MRRFLRTICFAAVLAVTAGLAVAAPHVEADPNKDYVITAGDGAWVVCAASFMGPSAPGLAKQLVYELRRRDNQPAFVFNHADEERRQLNEEFERLKQERPEFAVRPRKVRIEEQCAVLVGGYKDIETARAALTALKKLPPPNLKAEASEIEYFVQGQTAGKASTERSPFATAFVTRNPALPPEPKPTVKFDPLWKKLNANEDYSLLNCKKPYTLLVKEYRGAEVIQPKSGSGAFLDAIGLGGNKPGETLAAAGAQAHELARLLRTKQFNLESYVLHTRNCSYVSVGAFDSPKGDDIERVKRQVATLNTLTTRTKDGRVEPIHLVFDNPVPMEVPREGK
jgi:hypothetical protein